MKIVIQHPQNLMYLSALHQWTSDARQAMIFETFRIAVDFCVTHKLGSVQIVLKAEDEDGDIRIPLASPEKTPTMVPMPSAPVMAEVPQQTMLHGLA
jgi:hypothetical protein